MASWYDHIDDERRAFIERQHLFFVATASADPDDGYPNLSPKGRNLLRVLGPNLVGYVDYPGSGNETARHTGADGGKITIMLTSFDATAGTVRLYGRGRAVDLDHPDLRRYRDAFRDDFHPYVRQAFFVEVEKVQTSCGYSIPRMTYVSERDTLDKWCERKLEPREMVDGMPQTGELRAKVAGTRVP
jgi:predicted pyridoxine 5'-phosphate oxidase superfamily flavin-nucleotide-binding protein